MDEIAKLEIIEKIKKLEKIGESAYHNITKEYSVVFKDDTTMYNDENGFSEISALVSFEKLKTIKFQIWHGYFGSGFSIAIKDQGKNPKPNLFIPIHRSFDSTSIWGFEELRKFKLEDLKLGKVKITKLVNVFDSKKKIKNG